MLFVAALIFICAAHTFRILRWEMFINTYEKPDRAILFRSLSAAYIFNAFLPLKLGELLRAHLSGKHMKNGRGFSLATIIIERYFDILVVGLVFAIMCVFEKNAYNLRSFYFYVFAASAVLIFTAIAYLLRGKVKKIIVKAASIFNINIEFFLLKFSWSLICGFKDVLTRISKRRLLLHTFCMWMLYLASYYCFAGTLKAFGSDATWQNVFYSLFADNSLYLGNLNSFSLSGASIFALINAAYIILPSLFLLVVSYIIRSDDTENSDDRDVYLNLIPHLDEQERLNFLEMYFSDNHREYIESYLALNRNIEIIKDYSAGSNATTMLCRRGEQMFFRKYAFGSAGDKLWQQVEWLRSSQSLLPLTEILRAEHKDNYCYYDMPYHADTMSMFEYAHCMPINSTWNILQDMLKLLERSIYKINRRSADNASVEQYIDKKVVSNLNSILNAEGPLAELTKSSYISINGRKYKNLPALQKYLQKEHLSSIFSEDEYSVIHGDLTIENIICSRSGAHYIIDPNTGNIHDTPYLDYAKILQSIHGGYEFLMQQKDVETGSNSIDFTFFRSGIYDSLYKNFDAYLYEKFSYSQVKSIYYHEIVHWLRLMPYKIKKDGKRAALFYAGMIIIMNDIIERFETVEK